MGIARRPAEPGWSGGGGDRLLLRCDDDVVLRSVVEEDAEVAGAGFAHVSPGGAGGGDEVTVPEHVFFERIDGARDRLLLTLESLLRATAISFGM
jgi:hypothetical protein